MLIFPIHFWLGVYLVLVIDQFFPNNHCAPWAVLLYFQVSDTSESPVCQKHISFRDPMNSDDFMEMGNLPRVVLQLRSFSAQVHSLLQSHDGSLPLVR